MEIGAMVLTIFLILNIGGRSGFIRLGSNYPSLEHQEYMKTNSNSFIRFKIGNFEKRVIPVLFFIRVQMSPPHKYYKSYTIPIDEKSFLEAHYGKNKVELSTIPTEIKENPSSFFLTDCDYIIQLPPGHFKLFIGNSKTGVMKIFQSVTSSTPDFIVEPNQTYDVTLIRQDDKVFFSSGKIISTPESITEIKKCSLDTKEANDKQ